MGKKTSKWLRNFLPGRRETTEKDKEKGPNPPENSLSPAQLPGTPIASRPATPKEKRRWSFRRSSDPPKETSLTEPTAAQQTLITLDEEGEQKNHAMAMAAASAAAADAAVAAAQAAAAVFRLTNAAVAAHCRPSEVEEAAAVKIQSVFRSFLARKALRALKGLVKLQALVRGHLTRTRATATLRCMQALMTAQARARAQRILMIENGKMVHPRPPSHRKSSHRGFKHEMDRIIEENIKIVEMDYGELNKVPMKSRRSYSHQPQPERSSESRFSAHSQSWNKPNTKQDSRHTSPAQSAITDHSRGACSGHLEDAFFNPAQCYSAITLPEASGLPMAGTDYTEHLSYDYPLYPNYMSNTESSRAKLRSHSAPKQRPDSFEKQMSRRRASMELKNAPRLVRMQRSSSQAQNLQDPWSIKLDSSTISLRDSECGSSSTVLTNSHYCRSLVGFDTHGNR